MTGMFPGFAGGGRESTTANMDTQVRIPRRIMWTSTFDDCLSITLTAGTVYLLIALFWALVSRDREWCMTYWSCLGKGFVGAWYVFRVTFWIPLIFAVRQFDLHRYELHHYRFSAEQRDPHYPGPYKQRDPEDAGLTYWDHVERQEMLALMRERAMEAPEAQPVSRVPPVISERDDGSMSDPSMPPLPAEYGEYKLSILLRNVMSRPPLRTFSRDGAMRRGLYTRPEWEQLAKWCAHKDRRFYRDKRGLTGRGKRWAYDTIQRLTLDNGIDHPPTVRERWDNGNGHETSVPSHPIPSNGGGVALQEGEG